MITADLCIIPMGIKEPGVGKYVAKAAQIIEESGLNYQITAMGTQIETEDLKKLYEVCREVQESIFEMEVPRVYTVLKIDDMCREVQESIFEMGVPRVYTVLKIDDRRDKENRTLEEKVKSVKNRM